MSFKSYIKEVNMRGELPIKDPPLLLQMRRTAIRNYPNQERVALYVAPQLGISLAIPYDYASGRLMPTNTIPANPPVKESINTTVINGKDTMRSFKDIRTESKTVAEDLTPAKMFQNSEKIACLQAALFRRADDRTQLGAAITGWLASELEEYGSFDGMPQAVLDDVFDDFIALVQGSKLAESITEELNEAAPAKVPGVSRFGNKSPYVKFKQVAVDKPKKATSGASPSTKRVHTLSDYATWYDEADKKGKHETQFKLHNSGNTTSAFHQGKKIGDFHHDKKVGTIHEGLIAEQVLIETPMHQINLILKNNEEKDVRFNNGAHCRVNPVTAELVHNLFHSVNSTNKHKVSELVNASPEGLVKVAKFASQAFSNRSKSETAE